MRDASPTHTCTRRQALGYAAGGLAFGLASFAGLRGCRRRPALGRPNILLITLDTTRADHLGCYGYARNTSPHLDRLSGQCVVYDRTFSTASWTLPSHAALFTGKFTTSHGARFDPAGPLHLANSIESPNGWEKYRARGLSPHETTLADLLARAGYATGAVVGGPWLKKPFGLAKGFQHYDDGDIGTVNGRSADSVTDGALTWLAGLGTGPFFLFLNYFDPHAPYAPPRQYLEPFLGVDDGMDGIDPKVRRVNARYDGEILYMDQALGNLFEGLKRKNLWDNTWIIITADHGDILGEHGVFGHGRFLFEVELRVPFMMKHPLGDVSPGRRNTIVQPVDVLPWICDRLDIEAPPGIQGGVPRDRCHPIIAEVYPLTRVSDAGDWRVIVEYPYKFHWNSKGRHQLFHLGRDPYENEDLHSTQTRRSKRMQTTLEQYLASLPPPPAAEGMQAIDEETQRTLKSLGYTR